MMADSHLLPAHDLWIKLDGSSSAQKAIVAFNFGWLKSLSLTSIMATLYGHDTHYDFAAPKEETIQADDMNRIKKELDLLKNAV